MQSVVSTGAGDSMAESTYYAAAKKSLAQNRHIKQLPADFSQLTMIDSSTRQVNNSKLADTTSVSSQHPAYDKRVNMAMYEQAQRRPGEFAQRLIAELESLVSKHGKSLIYDENVEEECRPVIPLPIHGNVLYGMSWGGEDDRTSMNPEVTIQPYHLVNQAVAPHLHHYKPTFKSVEVKIVFFIIK